MYLLDVVIMSTLISVVVLGLSSSFALVFYPSFLVANILQKFQEKRWQLFFLLVYTTKSRLRFIFVQIFHKGRYVLIRVQVWETYMKCYICFSFSRDTSSLSNSCRKQNFEGSEACIIG